ncbi:MAG: sensor histidine kinase [Lachnospiraceae bacterium]|jgi:two-component system sensor histidine kinase YesM|nr:sensor histidine kinase [Lachnospiraceae bacterium]
MHKKIKESYFYRIFASMFAVCLVFVLLMGTVTGGVFYGLYQNNLKEACQVTAERIRVTVESTLQNYRETIQELDSDEGVVSFMKGETQDVNALIQELYMLRNSYAQRIAISAIRLSDQKCISTSKDGITNLNKEFPNWGIFRKASLSKEAALYAMAKDALLSSEDRLCMAKACRNEDGEILGYLLVEIPRSTLDAIVIECADQYNTNTLIVNKSASVIYHSGGTVFEGLGKAEDYGFCRETQETEGITVNNYAFSRSEQTGLTMMQEIPSGTLSVIMKPLLWAMAVGVLVSILLALIFSRRLAKSVSDPIEEMIEVMGKVEEGDLSVRLNFERVDEIGQLGKAFDSMTERVEELMERIEEEKHSLWIAETRSLSLQMNPHFLYNTLDLIKWNAKLGKNQEIVNITVHLGRVLRRIMNTKSDLVEISYEMEIIHSFVEIQKKHYGERLSLEVEIEEELMGLYIPKLVLQPIVENAIVHGFAGETETCRIRIAGKRRQKEGDPACGSGFVVFRIEDDGIGMSEQELEHVLEFKQEGMHHIGLNNVQRRARLFGDESCGIRVESHSGRGTAVTLVLRAVEKLSGSLENALYREV